MRRPAPALTIWFVFLGLAFIWGSSFLFIKIGLDHGLPPLWLVTWRVWIAVAVLGVVLRLTGARLPRGPRAIAVVVVMGVINVAIPFALIAWGEQFIPSALASILNGLVPLFTIVIAAAVLVDEPITLNRLVGLLIGFAGAVLLVLHGFDTPTTRAALTPGAPPAVLGELAIVVACISYAGGIVWARAYISNRPLVVLPDGTRRAMRPVEIALVQCLTAAVLVLVLALALEPPTPGTITVGPAVLPADAAAWLAVVWLGGLGSGVAYLLYFRLIAAWDATRTALVTYIMPIVGIALGVMVLGEQVEVREILGAILIIGGIALVNSHLGARRLAGRTAERPAG